MKTTPRLACLFTLCSLAACGGGGSGTGGSGPDATAAGDAARAAPSAANAPPTLSGQPALSASHDADYLFRPQASDPEGDVLRFNVTQLPAWASFDATTGSIAGRPGVADRGPYGPITVSVSDGTHQVALEPFTIEVLKPVPPVASTKRSVTLSWQPPPPNADGTPTPDELRYRIHIGAASRHYTESVMVPDDAGHRFQFEMPAQGTYYLAMTSLTADGLESPYSDEVTARLN